MDIKLIYKNATLESRAVFKLNTDKELTIKYNNKTIRLTQEKNPKLFLSPRTIASMYGKGGVAFVRDVLGIKDKPKIPPPVEARVRILNQNIPEEIENISPQDWRDVIDQAIKTLDDIETSYDAVSGKKDIGVNTDNLILDQNIRDLKRAHKFFNSINGQIKIAANKISVYDEQIARLKAERDRVNFNREDGVEINEERLREINNEIRRVERTT